MANRTTITKLLAYLRAAYPTLEARITEETRDVWHDAFRDTDDATLLEATRSMCKAEKFPSVEALERHVEDGRQAQRKAHVEAREIAIEEMRLLAEGSHALEVQGADPEAVNRHLSRLRGIIGRVCGKQAVAEAAAPELASEDECARRKLEQLRRLEA